MVKQLKLGFVETLRLGWGPNVAFVSGMEQGQSFGFGLELELSEPGLDLGSEGSELQQAL